MNIKLCATPPINMGDLYSRLSTALPSDGYVDISVAVHGFLNQSVKVTYRAVISTKSTRNSPIFESSSVDDLWRQLVGYSSGDETVHQRGIQAMCNADQLALEAKDPRNVRKNNAGGAA